MSGRFGALPHIPEPFSAHRPAMARIRLPGHHHAHSRRLHQRHLLWILLRSCSAEDILGYGSSSSSLTLTINPLSDLQNNLNIQIISLGALTTTILLNPKFSGPQWRTFRLFSFVGTGLSAFAPIAHAAALFGLDGLSKLGVLHYLAEGMLLIIASYIYEVSGI